MKTLKRILTPALSLFAALMLLSSCDHKELCYHHPHGHNILIKFDWRDAPDANVEGMAVFFYPLDADTRGYGTPVGDQDALPPAPVYRVDLGPDGGYLRQVPPGKYRVITYNNDTDGVLFDGLNNYDTHRGYTREGSLLEPLYGNTVNRAPAAEGAEGQRVLITPDPMWGYYTADVEVTDYGITYICVPESEKGDYIGKPVTSEDYVITLYPHDLTCLYTYEIRNVKNLPFALQQTATLSGMAPHLYFGSEQLGEEPVTIPFSAYSDGVSNITGRFYTWGHHPEGTAPHIMVLYIWMKGESKGWYYTFDVTDQVHKAPDKRRVHIVIDNLELPTPIGDNDESFDPSVDDWDVVDVVLPMV